MATKVGSAYFDVTINTTAARREMTALVSVANRQFGLLGGVAIVGATVAIGAAVTATYQLGSAAVDVANEYEHAFARVRKTLDDGTLSAAESAQAFGALNDELRAIALETPLDLSSEIAEIAALGGQMGIARRDIGEFTQVIGELGVTTTLTVEDAATQFSRLSNIVGLPSSEFRNMADDLVHLGNNFAATEDEILRFSLRIAAAGEIVGFSESDVLALASAMTAVGVPAERGGTAVQRSLIRIQRAVADGSEELQVFGAVSGLTAAQFAEAWRADPAQAFRLFIEGVGRSGEGAFDILSRTNLANERTIQSLLSLANAGDLYGRALDTAAESAGALDREADIFFNTTTSKLKLLGNTAKDAAITMGEPIQGPLRELIDGLTEWITTNDVLFTQIGTNLAAALEGLTPLILSVVDGIARATQAWSDFLAELNTPGGQSWDWLFGEDPEPKGVPSELQEWQDFMERGFFADPHIAKTFDTLLPGSVGLATQLTISEDMLRRMVKHGGELSGHRISSGFNQEGILEEMTSVEMLAAALVDLDERWTEFGGLEANRWGFDELNDELDLSDDKIREVIALVRQAGVDLPREILIEFGVTYVSGRRPRGRGAAPETPTDLTSIDPLTGFDIEQQLADQEAAAEAAKAWADALKDTRDAAGDLNIPVGVLLDNVDRLAPSLAPAVDQFGAGAIEAQLFSEALARLGQSIDFDLSDVTDEFDLMLTRINKAGDEVPATMDQMIADLQKQANQLAELEAATAILEALGFDDLAAELYSKGPEATAAAVDFVNNIDKAIEAENILDTGGSISEELLAGLVAALETGDITPELLDLIATFTSEQVKSEARDAGNELVTTIKQSMQEKLAERTDIRVPVNLIPEITYGPTPEYEFPGVVPPPSTPAPPGPPKGGPGAGGVLLQFTSPQVPLTDAARAAQLVRGILT